MVMGRIPEHQRVFAHLVFEIVIDASSSIRRLMKLKLLSLYCTQ